MPGTWRWWSRCWWDTIVSMQLVVAAQSQRPSLSSCSKRCCYLRAERMRLPATSAAGNQPLLQRALGSIANQEDATVSTVLRRFVSVLLREIANACQQCWCPQLGRTLDGCQSHVGVTIG